MDDDVRAAMKYLSTPAGSFWKWVDEGRSLPGITERRSPSVKKSEPFSSDCSSVDRPHLIRS
jgi:hypothetical protein